MGPYLAEFMVPLMARVTPIEVGSGNLSAIATEVTVAQVISYDDENIGEGGSDGRCSEEAEQSEENAHGLNWGVRKWDYRTGNSL